MLRIAIIALLALAWGWAFIFPALAWPNCVKREHLFQQFEANQGVGRMMYLRADELAQAMAWVNKRPPATNDTATVGVVIELRNGQAVFSYGDGGSLCGGFVFTEPELFKSFIQAIGSRT